MDAARTGILLIRARATGAFEQEIGFRQNSSFYYLTGVYNVAGALLALDADTRETWLFVPEGGRPATQEAAELKIDHVVSWTEFEDFITRRLRADPALILRVLSIRSPA